jgi:flagellar basal body P-ring protein FlgI
MDLNPESIGALREFLTKYEEAQKVKITLDKTDFSLLSEQKQTLLNLIELISEANLDSEGISVEKSVLREELTKSHLQGLVHFLDHVQDQAVEAGVPEKIVFPNLGE